MEHEDAEGIPTIGRGSALSGGRKRQARGWHTNLGPIWDPTGVKTHEWRGRLHRESLMEFGNFKAKSSVLTAPWYSGRGNNSNQVEWKWLARMVSKLGLN